MKLTSIVPWAALLTVALGNPFRLDTNVDDVHLDPDTDAVRGREPARTHENPSGVRAASLPVVTLPYEYHLASPDIKPDQKYYNFSNIPFAQPPLKQLRFKAAQGIPVVDEAHRPINDGQKTVVCVQQQVGWVPMAKAFLEELFNPLKQLDSKWEQKITPTDYPVFNFYEVPNQSEDCLVLDVFVSKELFNRGPESDTLAPVVVSIFGGGFIFGSKTIFGNPESIMEQAADSGGEVIVVSINYRLGLYGWLGGSKFTEEQGAENAGLTDQVEAIKWVKNNIRKFNGDPNKITLLGESAGASSIMMHLTAYGGDAPEDEKPLFQQAIMQSTGYFPQSGEAADDVFSEVLARTGADDLKDLQTKSEADLRIINTVMTYYAPYGQFKFGPTVTGNPYGYVQGPPTELMKAGKFYKDIKVLFANNRREGVLFTPPWLRNSTSVVTHMTDIYQEMSPGAVSDFRDIYDFNGDLLSDKDKFSKASAPFGDLGVDCNAWSLRQAYSNDSTYEYYYNIYPGLHGQDVGATWWPTAGAELTTANVKEQSLRLQRYLTSFIKTGNPNQEKGGNDKTFNPVGRDKKPSVFFIGSALLPNPINGATDQYNDNIKVPRLLPYATDPVPDWKTCNFWASSPWRYHEDEDDSMQSRLRMQDSAQPEL